MDSLHSGKIWSSEGQGVDRIRYDFYQIRVMFNQICIDSESAYISTEPGD
jgi:hypothetical protein